MFSTTRSAWREKKNNHKRTKKFSGAFLFPCFSFCREMQEEKCMAAGCPAGPAAGAGARREATAKGGGGQGRARAGQGWPGGSSGGGGSQARPASEEPDAMLPSRVCEGGAGRPIACPAGSKFCDTEPTLPIRQDGTTRPSRPPSTRAGPTAGPTAGRAAYPLAGRRHSIDRPDAARCHRAPRGVPLPGAGIHGQRRMALHMTANQLPR